MGRIAVNRLQLRCATEARERARFALEDALRTALPDPRRLVLLRRMVISGAGSGAHVARRQAAVRDGWQAAIADARHGGADGADTANCVWFENRDEAELLLLARLLAGRGATAWFWPLALPTWRGGPAAVDWLRQGLDDAIRHSDDARALQLVETAIAAGATAIVLAAAGGASTAPAGIGARADPPAGGFADGAADVNRGATDAHPGPAGRANPAPTPHPAPLALNPAETQLVALLVRQGIAGARLLRIVVRALALRRSPALALAPMLLAEVSAQIIAGQSGATPTASRAQFSRTVDTRDYPDRVASLPAQGGDAGSSPLSAGPPGTFRRVSGQPEPGPVPARVDLHSPPAPAPAPLRLPGRRLASPHAGLWLAIPSLIEMGLREWLRDHPEWLGAHPGRQLLLAIARHHRVPAQDPALRLLEAEAYPGRLPDWTADWRRGLDGWLRRRARRRLHDLVRRPGTIEFGDRRIELLFPAEAADIRLRRRALDRDPGWTDWLGVSIRYHFGDNSAGFSP